MKTKSALSYFGSDSEVAGQLASLLNHCSHVTIPFVGGASIIPHMTARAIVANDLHLDAINFYRVVSGVYGTRNQVDLLERCLNTLSHPDELDMASRVLAESSSYVLDRAWAFWAQCWIGRKGCGGTSSPASLPSVRWKATGGTNASRLTSAARDLDEWAETFKRCEWTCLSYEQLIPRISDDVSCGVYCDPPWHGAGDSYKFAFSAAHHDTLANLLERFTQTTVVIRYGDVPWVRERYGKPGWTILDASSRNQANKVKGELWIINRSDVATVSQ